MRVLVTGTSGSGKTTLGRRLAVSLRLPHIELDAINWQPGWRGLNAEDKPEFIRRVAAAIAEPGWVADGNYGDVRRMIWARATHVIWLDYPRWLIMSRVLRRSVLRALDRRELWPGTGNRESIWKWFDKEHPIRWAWSTADRRRRDYEALVQLPEHSHLNVMRIRRPVEAEAAVAALEKERKLPQ